MQQSAQTAVQMCGSNSPQQSLEGIDSRGRRKVWCPLRLRFHSVDSQSSDEGDLGQSCSIGQPAVAITPGKRAIPPFPHMAEPAEDGESSKHASSPPFLSQSCSSVVYSDGYSPEVPSLLNNPWGGCNQSVSSTDIDSTAIDFDAALLNVGDVTPMKTAHQNAVTPVHQSSFRHDPYSFQQQDHVTPLTTPQQPHLSAPSLPHCPLPHLVQTPQPHHLQHTPQHHVLQPSHTPQHHHLSAPTTPPPQQQVLPLQPTPQQQPLPGHSTPHHHHIQTHHQVHPQQQQPQQQRLYMPILSHLTQTTTTSSPPLPPQSTTHVPQHQPPTYSPVPTDTRPATSSPPALRLPSPPASERIFVVTVQFKHGRTGLYAIKSLERPQSLVGMHVVVDGDRGEDLGVIIAHQPYKSSFSPNMKCVLSIASAEDVAMWKTTLLEQEKEAKGIAQEIIRKHDIDMTILYAEFQFDKKKLTFYFSSKDPYPNFRHALAECFSNWKCRIWFSRVEQASTTAVPHP